MLKASIQSQLLRRQEAARHARHAQLDHMRASRIAHVPSAEPIHLRPFLTEVREAGLPVRACLSGSGSLRKPGSRKSP